MRKALKVEVAAHPAISAQVKVIDVEQLGVSSVLM
jgi:hypothetical protein